MTTTQTTPTRVWWTLKRVAALAPVVAVLVAAIVIVGRFALAAMIGSRIAAVDNSGQWVLFTAWDLEHAARTAPWPIQLLALTAAAYTLTKHATAGER